MAKFGSFYKGNTFSGTVQYAPRKGWAATLIGYTATSMVLDSAGNRHSGACTIAEDGLSVFVEFSQSITKDWANGMAKWNVRFEDSQGRSFSTGIFEFEVENPPTVIT